MGDGAARQDSDKPIRAAGGQARGRDDARQRISDEPASPPRRAAEELARSRDHSGREDEHREIDDLHAQDADCPSRRVSQREVQARLRQEDRSASDATARPLHAMLLAISAAGEVRKEMLFALAQRPRDVGTLARDMDLDQPRVSQHLAQLRKVGLVSCVCEGGRRVYSVGRHTQWSQRTPRQVLVTRGGHAADQRRQGCTEVPPLIVPPRRPCDLGANSG